MVYGLPVSLRLFFFGLGTVIAGHLCSRWGWRPVFLTGVGLLAVGLAAAALVPDLNWFLVASLPIGFGTGLGMIGLRSLIHAEGKEGDESRTYSHFYAGIIAGTNVGVIVGSGLADSIGFANVFWVAVVRHLVGRLDGPASLSQADNSAGNRRSAHGRSSLRVVFLQPPQFCGLAYLSSCPFTWPAWFCTSSSRSSPRAREFQTPTWAVCFCSTD